MQALSQRSTPGTYRGDIVARVAPGNAWITNDKPCKNLEHRTPTTISKNQYAYPSMDVQMTSKLHYLQFKE